MKKKFDVLVARSSIELPACRRFENAWFWLKIWFLDRGVKSTDALLEVVLVLLIYLFNRYIRLLSHLRLCCFDCVILVVFESDWWNEVREVAEFCVDRREWRLGRI